MSNKSFLTSNTDAISGNQNFVATSLNVNNKKTTSGQEVKPVNKRAVIIASAAAASGTPLPPFSSLTPEQQQKYFAWIKQLHTPSDSESIQHSMVANSDISTSNILQPSVLLINQQQQKSLRNTFDLGNKTNTSQSINDIGTIGSGRPRFNDNSSTLKNLSQPASLAYFLSQEKDNQNRSSSLFTSCTALQKHSTDIFQTNNTRPLSQFSLNTLFSVPNKSGFGLERSASTVFGNQLPQSQQQVSQSKNVFSSSVITTTASGKL